MMKKMKMDISMVMMSVRMGCTVVPVNIISEPIKQACRETCPLSHGKELRPQEPQGAHSFSLLPSLDILLTPRDIGPTYQANELDLSVPQTPELSIAVLEFPLVTATPLPRSHFIFGLL